jgi:hypothetical protein
MLKKLAVALVAASVFAAPVLAQTGSTGHPGVPSQAGRGRSCGPVEGHR